MQQCVCVCLSVFNISNWQSKSYLLKAFIKKTDRKHMFWFVWLWKNSKITINYDKFIVTHKKIPMPHTHTKGNITVTKVVIIVVVFRPVFKGTYVWRHSLSDNTINTFIILLHPAETVHVVQIILVEQQTTLTEIKTRAEQYFTCSEDSDHRIAANSKV